MGLTYGVFGSDLVWSSGMEATIQRRAATISFERRMSETWVLSLSGGMSLPGHLRIDGERHDILPGWLGALTSSWRLMDGEGSKPFMLVSVTLAGSGARTREAGRPSDDATTAQLLAFDARAGLTVGKTFSGVISPYAGVRLFGGPILWRFRGEDLGGTDQHHYQLAIGMSSSLPAGIDLFAEIAPLGERAAAVGGGVTF